MEVVKSNEYKHATSKETQQKSFIHIFQFHYRFMGYASVQELASAAFSYLYHNI